MYLFGGIIVKISVSVIISIGSSAHDDDGGGGGGNGAFDSTISIRADYFQIV